MGPDRALGAGAAWVVALASVVAVAAGCGTKAVPTVRPLDGGLDGRPGDGGGDAPLTLDGRGDGVGDGFVRPDVGTCTTPPAMKKPMGQACGCHEECNSGFCVDGVCCSSACGGPCLACNVQGSMGQCTPVPDGQPPVDPAQCMKQPASSCGFDGLCNGLGGCRRHPDGTECAPGRCAGNGIVGGKQCNDGSCSAEATVACFPYGCDGSSNKCFARCTSDSQCAGEPCRDGQCGKKSPGAVCQTGAECESGSCADGVCCNVACSGPCVSCKEPGKMGQCTPVAAGAPDPHGICPVEPPETCGSSGACNGLGGCARYTVGTVCRLGSCSGGSFMPPSVCDGQGTCEGGSPISCAPFLCKDGACQGTCASAADCVPPNSCQGQSCGKKGLGQVCRAASECGSGFCVDGVCCDSGCDGRCVFCAQPNALGRCVNVPADAADPRASAGVTDPARICPDQGAASCGTNGRCDGQGGCASYANGTICQAESCDASANRYAIGTCLNGACATTTRSCTPNRCNGNQCGQRCTTDTECATPNVCVRGSCGRKPNGEPCTASNPTECASGICAQGVCCASACTGSCVSCALPQSAGVCTPVPAGAADPTGQCQDQRAPSCGRDGVCDGRGQCRLYASGTVCANSSCSGGMARAASRCDGMGMCIAAPIVACAPIIVCNASGTACETTCVSDAQCVTGTKCFNGRCGLLGNGRPCTGNGDCMSGFCVDGVCCNSACGGNNQNDCQACSRAAGAGGDGSCGARNGARCSDGNPCTLNDACRGMNCNGTELACTALDQCHNAGTCDRASGRCTNPPKADGSTCNDMNRCTSADACRGGSCAGTVVMCMGGGGQCQDPAACDPADGTCKIPNKLPGTMCNDGNACTQTDTCQAGVCGGSNAIACPETACQMAGSCDAASGMCSRVNKPNGTACNADNNMCTTDSCQNGTCEMGPTRTCVAGMACQAASSCDPADGQCKGGANLDNGTSCSDGNACTGPDTCTNGMCAGPVSVTCPGATMCRNASTCDANSGTCVGGGPRTGMGCDDGSACTTGDTCGADGECHGTAVSCQGETACLNASVCNPASGCAARTPKPSSAACDDGNACTSGDHCDGAGVCVGGTTMSCPSSNVCRGSGTCDPVSGACNEGPPMNGIPCSDNNMCTVSDICSGGSCQAGAPLSCPPPPVCFQGGCDPAAGCTNGDPVSAGTMCNDGNLCTIGDTCNGSGSCQPGAAVDCSDDNLCTSDPCSPATGCGTHPPVDCNDSNMCTADSCGPTIGCVHTPVDCNDNDMCTTDSCATASGCAHATVSCDDGMMCTMDSCAPGTGCANTPITGTAECP